MKFKIGDIVIANNKSQYHITCEGFIGQVVEDTYNVLEGSHDMMIKGLKNDKYSIEDGVDRIFDVNSEYFDLHKAYNSPLYKALNE